MSDLVLFGRSSSHFTRTARLFALELGVEHRFSPIFDMTVLDAAAYGDNPALKMPVLVDSEGPLFGAENICLDLARRAGRREEVVLRGDVESRVLANCEELTLHVMSNEVTLILAKIAGDPGRVPEKVRRGVDNSLRFLDDNVDRALAALPGERALSFFEAGLFSVLTHLPWREVMDVSAYRRLSSFTRSFGERGIARATEYKFDTP